MSGLARKSGAVLAAICAGFCFPQLAHAQAQTFPNRPVTL